MAIKNYSTGKKPAETIGDIQAELSYHGANQVSISYDNGEPDGKTLHEKMAEGQFFLEE